MSGKSPTTNDDMKVNFAHCLFEQSGTFKDEFIKLGITAIDYDIANDFGVTDRIVDIFAEINKADFGLRSIFDYMTPDDIIMVFFPCTYFCENNVMYFSGNSITFRKLTKTQMLDSIIEREKQRHDYYITLLKFCKIVESRGLRAVVENPYNAHHYWRNNFPYKPQIIHMNRRLYGDKFRKPTQYIFINCEPAGKISLQSDKPEEYIRKHSGIERSIIHPDYAHNFICDHILGIDSGNTQPLLFTNL